MDWNVPAPWRRGFPKPWRLDEVYDLLAGTAGAIVPLLLLGRRTGEDRYLRMASEFGDRLCERAQRKGDGAFWSQAQWPEGMGGFAHGVTGIGWALTKLAEETGAGQHQETARAAFAFEDALFDEEDQNWLDLRLTAREPEDRSCLVPWFVSASDWRAWTWIQVSSNPATRQILQRTAAATWRLGMGWNHCACHGDLGAWELLERAIALGEGPKDLTPVHLRELLLTSLEIHGPSAGITRDAFPPGLLAGYGRHSLPTLAHASRS